MTVSEVIKKMVAYSEGNLHDINHFMKVYAYAKTIAEGENLTPELQKLVEITAVVHDIACPLCRVKYGNTTGKHQEEESAALLEELNANYVIGARARGIPERRIIWGHVLPNAILPIVTLLGLSVGHLLGGAAIIETIFSWQGIGNMVVEAIRVRDYPLIQGYVIWMAIIYVTVNLIVDIAYRLLDPQIRLRKRVD